MYERQRPKLSQRKRNARRQSSCLKRLYKIAEEGREVKGKAEREIYTQLNAVPENSRERLKALLK